MTTEVDTPLNPTAQPHPAHVSLGTVWRMTTSGLAAVGLVILLGRLHDSRVERSPADPKWDTSLAPLVMQEGDPYIRALMRTISAAESNSSQPYSLLYGGEHIQDLSHHPDQCVPIQVGPNQGDCSTAAGRYQFITTTWMEKAKLYHPHTGQYWLWRTYSFDPASQDEVVYRWLSDSQAWGADLSQLLQQGHLDEVLAILSPTWTSLGYGIESNAMTEALPHIYQQVLQEELNLKAGI